MNINVNIVFAGCRSGPVRVAKLEVPIGAQPVEAVANRQEVMLRIPFSAMTLAFAPAAVPARAEEAAAPETPKVAADAPGPEACFEIFKRAPGKQQACVRDIARAGQVSAAATLPPIRIFVHEEGADRDILPFKPARTIQLAAAQQAAMAARSKELNMESGPACLTRISEPIASHTDTKTNGPLTAAPWLARLDKRRVDQSDAARAGQ